MSYNFRTISSFERDLKRFAKRYHSLRDDVKELVKELQENPLMGTDLGHGIHKIRLAIKSKGSGKRGGARVIVHTDVIVVIREGTICFLALYDKSEQSTITDKAIKALLYEAGII